VLPFARNRTLLFVTDHHRQWEYKSMQWDGDFGAPTASLPRAPVVPALPDDATARPEYRRLLS
jgi:hypothetical protein